MEALTIELETIEPSPSTPMTTLIPSELRSLNAGRLTETELAQYRAARLRSRWRGYIRITQTSDGASERYRFTRRRSDIRGAGVHVVVGAEQGELHETTASFAA